MFALVQKNKGDFASINAYIAFLGFREKGYFIEFFEAEELSSKNLDDETIVVGGIPRVIQALNMLGMEIPDLESVPESIQKYAQRLVWQGTINDARVCVDKGASLFIKPLAKDRKLFVGKVVKNYRDLANTASLEGTYPVICSEPISMVSEYRVFVINGEIVGCKHYKGDFRIFPDFKIIESSVNDFVDAPSGYGIDFAVTDSGETVLIEVNEGFSLGAYGLTPLVYSSLLEARWKGFKKRSVNQPF